MFRVAATLMKGCEIDSAVLFLHGSRQLTWLAPKQEGTGCRKCASEVIVGSRGSREKQMKLGTSGPAIVHRVERGGIVEDAELEGR